MGVVPGRHITLIQMEEIPSAIVKYSVGTAIRTQEASEGKLETPELPY